jgi:sugar phosphate isomerase/epimerase
MKKPSSRIAMNLYSVRDHCKTLDDLDRSFARLKSLGYLNIQISGVSYNAAQIRELLDKNGLSCCACHDNLNDLTNSLDTVIKNMRILGCTFTALGYPGEEYFKADGASRLPGILESIGSKLRAEGLEFGYHNHSAEFEKFGDKTMLEMIYDNTSRKNVKAEIDTYWVHHGGGDPAQWILKLKDRIPAVHLKDYAILDRTPVFCEVGEGNLDWNRILTACRKAGVEWYIVEQDNPFKDRDIFESLGRSHGNLKKMGLK